MEAKGWTDAPHFASSSWWSQSAVKSHILSASVHESFGGLGNFDKVLFSNWEGEKKNRRMPIYNNKTGMMRWNIYKTDKRVFTRCSSAVRRQTNGVYGDTSVRKIPDGCHYHNLQWHKNVELPVIVFKGMRLKLLFSSSMKIFEL